MNRIRDFVEHWGVDTELTAEIRLPPELREAIADHERIEDETRRRRMREAPIRDVFTQRPWSGAAFVVLAVTILSLLVTSVTGLDQGQRLGEVDRVAREPDEICDAVRRHAVGRSG